MKRIKYIDGQSSCLILAPHAAGPTDIRTEIISTILAQKTDSCAVINTGWIRPWVGTIEGTNDPANNKTRRDLKNGFANLNDLTDCAKKPLKDEFLNPIDIYKNFILGKHGKVNIFAIHGMDDMIRDYNGVDVILGFGNGNPPRYTCSLEFKDRVLGCLSLEGFYPAEGKSGGRLSAWNYNNLCQLYKQDKINTIQIEIALTLRNSDEKAIQTANRLVDVINRICSKEHVPLVNSIQQR